MRNGRPHDGSTSSGSEQEHSKPHALFARGARARLRPTCAEIIPSITGSRLCVRREACLAFCRLYMQDSVHMCVASWA